MLRDAARQRLAFAEEQYRETQNPVYAWEAFLDARQAGVDIPPDVLRYFERCAVRIAQITRRQRAFRPHLTADMTEQEYNAAIAAPDPVTLEEVARAVAMATEFVVSGRNGPVNKLKVHVDLSHEMSIATAVYFKLRQGEQKKYAIEHVADEHPRRCEHTPRCQRIDVRTVGRYWRSHASKFPPFHPDK